MIQLGKINNLKVISVNPDSFTLTDNETEVTLPTSLVTEEIELDSSIDVFVYKENDGKLYATMEMPKAQVGEFAFLRAVSLTNFGAFLDWGLRKNVLVPFREQKVDMEENRYYVVYIYLDEKTERIVASAKVDKFLDLSEPDYKINQEVDVLICQKTNLGYKAIINNSHSGVLYENEVFEPLQVGQKIKVFVKNIREDNKIDLLITKPGYEKKIDDIAQRIIDVLEEFDGFVEVTDKSEPEKIYDYFSMSKKNFKKAVGNLYKNKRISIEDEGIRLI